MFGGPYQRYHGHLGLCHIWSIFVRHINPALRNMVVRFLAEFAQDGLVETLPRRGDGKSSEWSCANLCACVCLRPFTHCQEERKLGWRSVSLYWSRTICYSSMNPRTTWTNQLWKPLQLHCPWVWIAWWGKQCLSGIERACSHPEGSVSFGWTLVSRRWSSLEALTDALSVGRTFFCSADMPWDWHTYTLQKYSGTVVVVTHNKVFCEEFAPTHTAIVMDGKIQLFDRYLIQFCICGEWLSFDSVYVENNFVWFFWVFVENDCGWILFCSWREWSSFREWLLKVFFFDIK